MARKIEKITCEDARNILDKTSKKCALSGVTLTPDNFSFDHIIPLSKGGDHTKENLQAVLSLVNFAKQNMSNDMFIALCKKVAEHNAHIKTKTFEEYANDEGIC